MKRGKRYLETAKLVDKATLYDTADAIALVKKTANAKFDETIEASIRLGIDTRYADQQVRGTVVLPHGTGRSVRVLVIAEGDAAKQAEEAGADYVGVQEYLDKIQKENWFEFDTLVTTPDMMRFIGRLGRVLGPKGLMPNPKSGTVTTDIGRAVEEIKAGKVEYRVDKTSIAHVPIGKASFDEQKLAENFTVLMDAIVRAKPSTAKGTYLRSVVLSATMGPSVGVNPLRF